MGIVRTFLVVTFLLFVPKPIVIWLIFICTLG
ncbi:hypothetical protein J2W42_006700 [Rhizobium tibeticum]|nr:hypothetical protein [Rhizobium tibeticum]